MTAIRRSKITAETNRPGKHRWLVATCSACGQSREFRLDKLRSGQQCECQLLEQRRESMAAARSKRE